MFLVKRTQDGRQYNLYLRAEHQDSGPYYLVDRAGFGVSWRRGHQRDFSKALLAFALVDIDESITPKEAKAASDWAHKHTYRTEAMRFWDALRQVERTRERRTK